MSTRRRRDRRQYEASMVRIFYPSMSWAQIRLLLRHAEHVRLLGGGTLADSLGR